MDAKTIRVPPKEPQVLWAMMRYPGLSDAQLCEAVGISRTSLYRMPLFRKVRGILKAQGKQALPRGRKAAAKDGFDGRASLEAWQVDDDDEDDC
jgi:hypothetical protein